MCRGAGAVQLCDHRVLNPTIGCFTADFSARVPSSFDVKTCDPIYCAAVKLQAQLRRLPHQRRFRQIKEAASKIQTAFFVWEMQWELLKLESSLTLLTWILKGDLGRSATMFALLLEINSALQSRRLLLLLESWLPMMLPVLSHIYTLGSVWPRL
jgi:hypothetical protein